MNLTSVKIIKELLLKHNARPSKGMGQNFLTNQKILAKIIEAAELSQNDIVLEVGPGIGTLTQELAKKAKRVIAVEKDKRMAEILKETLKDYKNIETINQDIRFLNSKSYILNSPYKVVANLPYYITSPVIRKFLEEENPPTMMVLMVQKEVAQRICAKPPDMNLLAVSVQFYAEPKILSHVKKESFWPKPKVDSAIIKIIPRNYAEFYAESRGDINPETFFKIVRAGFSQPRKQILGNLLKNLKLTREQTTKWLIENNINPARRAETLGVKDWHLLTRTFDGIQ